MCNVLNGFGSVPSLDQIMLEFTGEGMTLYGRPSDSPIIVTSFWAVDMFKDYQCTGTVTLWVPRDRMVDLRKKISKDVDCLTITKMSADGMRHIQFSGDRQCAAGGKCSFTFNVHEWLHTEDPLHLACSFSWKLVTSAFKFSSSVDFLDDKNDFVSMSIGDGRMTFDGVANTGMIGESISHDVDTLPSCKFNALFYKRYLKIVTSTQALDRMLNVSFSPDVEDSSHPVLFSYNLSKRPGSSHFSVYILPVVEQALG